LHHVFQFTGQNPEMDRVALAAYGAEWSHSATA
jgi:hypothetical protein